MPHSAQSLLLVEDDLALAGYLASALAEQGFTVRTTAPRPSPR